MRSRLSRFPSANVTPLATLAARITAKEKTEEGKEIAYKLVKEADVLIENFRNGVAERLGMDYETLKKINPKLIMIRVSGYGQTGPYSNRAGYGSIGEAMGGMRNLAGDPANPPSRVGISIGDSLAALLCKSC